MLAVVDAGPLYAAVDADDQDHDACVAVLSRADLELVVPALVVAEVTYLVGKRLGAAVEADFLAGLASIEIEGPLSEDLPRMANLVRRYADFPLGGTDAFVAVLADRLETETIITLDRRHFGALRTANGGSYRLLPA